ncbi:MAG TPA: RluA family pseudouridine synthase [Candidatus Atribacteria bacterium]|nr:RluA family pseudouridine synthase [Candidatus Atribacteria bacterium]HPT79296.1 RluA family pseudouridine synthase [Candidatus Atribacteria bacterium]
MIAKLDNVNPVKVKIVYEDNHLLAAIKPPNILSQADHTGDADMLTLLKGYIKEKYQKPGNVFLGLVHRLDRPVGGIMVFARTSKAASRLSEQIRGRSFEKHYLAVVIGTGLKQRDRLIHHLKKDRTGNKVYVVDSRTTGSMEAILDYDLLAVSGRLSLIKVRLLTGRPHQIRVQLQAIGHPLYGDRLYGPDERGLHACPIALWAYRLKFEHPTKKDILDLTAGPPDAYPWSLFDRSLYSL